MAARRIIGIGIGVGVGLGCPAQPPAFPEPSAQTEASSATTDATSTGEPRASTESGEPSDETGATTTTSTDASTGSGDETDAMASSGGGSAGPWQACPMGTDDECPNAGETCLVDMNERGAISFCAPPCGAMQCPPAPAGSRAVPTCVEGLCLLVCTGDSACPSSMVCYAAGNMMLGVCAWRT